MSKAITCNAYERDFLMERNQRLGCGHSSNTTMECDNNGSAKGHSWRDRRSRSWDDDVPADQRNGRRGIHCPRLGQVIPKACRCRRLNDIGLGANPSTIHPEFRMKTKEEPKWKT